jgi:hypothetical protein
VTRAASNHLVHHLALELSAANKEPLVHFRHTSATAASQTCARVAMNTGARGHTLGHERHCLLQRTVRLVVPEATSTGCARAKAVFAQQ